MSDTVTMTSDKQVQSEVLAKPPFENMVWIPGGTFLMGSDKHYPEEAPAHEVTVAGLDGSAHGNQRRVSQVCRSHQARDVRRACSEGGGLPGREAGAACSCLCGFQQATPTG